MAGHGSAPAEDRGDHPNRKVAKESWYTKPRGERAWYHHGNSGIRPGPSIKDRVHGAFEGITTGRS